MEAAKRHELERWADALARSDVAELRAAGRAIRALCAENDELERRLAALERRSPTPPGDDASGEGDETPPRRRRTAGLPWRRAVPVLGVAFLLAAVLALAAGVSAPDLAVTGPDSGAVIGREALPQLEFAADTAEAEWVLDGKPLQPRTQGGRQVWRPEALRDGEHELVVRRPGRFGAASHTIRFTVDTRPPQLRLAAPAAVRPGKPLELRGSLEPGAELRRGDSRIEVDESGGFRLELAQPPARLVLTATDAAGNASRWRVPVTVVPLRPAQPLRAVHVTAYAWADADLRRSVLDLVRAKRINAVELDLKDESGEVGWASGVPLAKRMGAQLDIYDLKKAVELLHGLGVRVIGRLVCFRDPIHAQAAERGGRQAELVRAPDGSPYAGYGGFTNFANPVVRKYNIDLAVAAAEAGVDEILYDYVRRPDGPLSSMVFPGIEGTPEQAIVEFLAQSRKALARTDALVGASVFGVAATRPTEVAQDIPAMARHVDYIAPMLYPSHWGPGEYDVADPNGEPYEIVLRSTKDFVRQVRGSGARIVNWLQDFSYGRDYGPEQVRAQIKASRDAGVDDFLLWNAAVSYTEAALEPTAAVPALGNTAAAPKGAPMPVRLLDAKPPVATPAALKPRPGTRPLPGLPANELGRIPVVMHHMIRPDRVGEYDQTPAEFRAELEYFWQHGYTPVNVGDLLSGDLDVPKGTTPVALTFDDSTTYQLDFTRDGRVKPATAVGIMLEFAKQHPGFVPKGTFYVNRTPFGSEALAKRALPWLIENGFEVGNHTHDHIPLRTLSDEQVREQVGTGAELILELLPNYRIRSLSLPLGSLPHDERLAVEGSWEGKRYGPYGVLLVGANPAPSPFAKAFDATAVPRIRTSHAGWSGEDDFAFSYWMKQLEDDPGSRYVSDGDPAVVTVQPGDEADVRPRYARRVRTG
ncbi:MAG TPA: putative glycoside hydrolase [Gaiellaceae bacterium]|nr:putative glycoside hydrolase [Gaiellaceae bacterium]